MDSQARIRALLRQRIGLDELSIGTPTLDRGIQRAMKAAGCASALEFWEHLQGNQTALQALIEEVVVPETWFFREPAALSVLQEVATQWLRTKQERPLRVLSMPCATGEEPYSIAISLMDVLGDPAKFTVDAVDISERSIAKAMTAEYGERAFRGQDLSRRRKYFEKTADGYRVIGAVRDRINFRTGNLIAPDLKTNGPYDCIFCRNVLIYLDRALKDAVTANLSRMLTPDGVLLVAAAEGAWLASSQLEQVPDTLSAFRKRRAAEPIPRPKDRTAAVLPKLDRPHTVPAPSHPLDLARAKADAGRLLEAAQFCRQYLQQESTSADGHYLLGQLHDAAGECKEAIAGYRRALYLDPHHQGALKQLALLHEQRGELRASRQWTTRLERLVGSAA